MTPPTVVLNDALLELIDHRGKTPRKMGGDWTESGHRVVSAINIKGSRVDDHDHHYVSDEIYVRWMKVPLRSGDVLLTSEAPTGEVAYLACDVDWCLGQRVFGLRADPSVLDGRYLFYQLRGGDARRQLLSRATGTTVSGIRQSELLKIRIELPELRVQRGIAATLGALDDMIACNQRAIDVSLRLLDLQAVSASAAATSSAPLGEIAEVARVTTDPASLNGLVDHFSLPAFDEGVWPKREDVAAIKSNKLRISQVSILVSRLNPRFNRTWWCEPVEGIPALASTEFMALHMTDERDLGALWLAVRDDYFMSELKRRVTGTSGSHQRIRPDDVLTIDVPDVRVLAEDSKARALELLQLVHQRRRANQRIASIRDSLLPDLLSGRIRVPEVAEVVEGAIA